MAEHSTAACGHRCLPTLHAVVEAFGQAGLLLPQDDRAVKLHATVINTRYRHRGQGRGSATGAGQQHQQQGQGQQQHQRQAIDGRLLLQQHAVVDLGAVALPAGAGRITKPPASTFVPTAWRWPDATPARTAQLSLVT